MLRASLKRSGLAGALLLLAAMPPVGEARPAEVDAGARREQALADLKSPAAETRQGACATLAETGGDADLPLLLSTLHDPAAEVRQAAEAAIWRIWSRSGDAEADRVFGIGVSQMQAGELSEAAQTFGRVIAMQPAFAEGWNKRATVYFMMGDFERSLRDCDEVIRRNPVHFGVLAGYGQIHLRRGELDRALDYFERALAINPNMDGVRASIEAIGRALSEKRRRFI
jgi:tetratricopeptide (TPR) repeat protein